MPSPRISLAYLLRTSAGRKALGRGLLKALGPLLSMAARLWRATGLRRVRIVALTGSFGKTTTSRAASAAFGSEPLRRAHTNDPLSAQLALLRMSPGRGRVVMELGIWEPGQMRPLARALRPDVAIVTWIGSEHSTSFKSLENTAREKSELVRALRPHGLAVLNGDDPRVMEMARLSPPRLVTFGLGPANDFRAENIAMDWPKGSRFDLVWKDGRLPAQVPLLGKPAIYAALAAASAAITEGEEPVKVVERLKNARGATSRLAPVALANGAYIIRDEHKGVAESFFVALETLAQIPAQRRIAVLGEFSERLEEHPSDTLRRLGALAAKSADFLIIYGHDNTAQRYRAGARAGGMAEDRLFHVKSGFQECADLLQRLLQPGDVALVKSRNETRLDRVALALMGRKVRCTIHRCSIWRGSCDGCPMLERGWEGLEAARKMVDRSVVDTP